jgi:hypothetical protein
MGSSQIKTLLSVIGLQQLMSSSRGPRVSKWYDDGYKQGHQQGRDEGLKAGFNRMRTAIIIGVGGVGGLIALGIGVYTGQDTTQLVVFVGAGCTCGGIATSLLLQ